MYLLDANVFIQAHRAHYGFNVVPGFWDWLDRAHHRGQLLSVGKVYEELVEAGDELTDWVRTRGEFFAEPDDEVVASFRDVSTWAQARVGGGQSSQAAVNEFLGVGDSFLVAHAHAHGFTLVTHETSEPDRKNRIKIPDVCNAFGIDCVSPFVMLARESARFVLQP